MSVFAGVNWDCGCNWVREDLIEKYKLQDHICCHTLKFVKADVNTCVVYFLINLSSAQCQDPRSSSTLPE